MLTIFEKIRKCFLEIKKIKNEGTYKPLYRILEISKSEEDEYYATIQIINKNISFDIKPEELLAHDSIVNKFSPTDIRNLTYLVYLGINSPKYTILAKHFSTDNEKIIFSIRKKGQKKIILKSALEIIQEEGFIDALSSEDSKVIGYTAASESVLDDKKQKIELLKNIEESS